MFGRKKRNVAYRQEDYERDLVVLLGMLSDRISRSHRHDEVRSELDMLKELADRGVAAAQYIYGLFMLDEGNDWSDTRKGVEYMEKAADAGMADAQFDLALFLFRGGKDYPRDPVMANYWMMSAADNGFPAAKLYRERRR